MRRTVSGLRVQHYKSLDSLSMRALGPVTVLVGPNAVGKSNVIDALKFVRDCVRDSIDHAITARGGIDTIRQWSPTRPYLITIEVEVCLHLEENAGDLFGPSSASVVETYELAIASIGSGNFRVERERASWYSSEWVTTQDGEEEVTYTDHPTVFTRDAEGNVRLGDKIQAERIKEDVVALGRFAAQSFEQLGQGIVEALQDFRVCEMYPNTLKQPTRPTSDRELKENGENWASIIKSMRSSDAGRRAFAKVLQSMQQILPDLKDVQVKSVGGYLVPQFLVFDEDYKRNHYLDPVQLSDGTLRLFGLLLALYQLPRPTVLAVEEPEQAVHPAALTLLADAVKEASLTSQVLLTTHSPHLVDQFPPHDLRIVYLDRGRTRVAELHGSQVEAVKRRLMSLEEFMMAEGLRPNV